MIEPTRSTPPSSFVPSAAVVALAGVERRFGSVVALAGLDLEVHPGEIVCLLGPNGAGKTTAVSLILGLLDAEAGSVRVHGGRPGTLAARRATGAMVQVGAVPQTLKVREHVELAAAWYGDPLPLSSIFRQAGLEGLENRLFGKLSGGQQRRVLFAMAIAGAPRLLVLDEPTVALDVEARRALWSRVRELAASGTAVLLTTHDLAEAGELATRVVMIHAGKVVANGTPAEVAALVGQRRLRCRSRMDVAVVRAWPEVAEAESHLGRLTLTTTAPEAVLRRLLAADPDVSEIEVSGASLEDALVALTHDHRTETTS
jgi:ABC-2 type transport system ATP-binding protein